MGQGSAGEHLTSIQLILPFSYVRWPLGSVSTAGFFRSSNVILRLDCTSSAVVKKGTRSTDASQEIEGKQCRKTAPFSSDLTKSLYYRVFFKLLFRGGKRGRPESCYAHIL